MHNPKGSDLKPTSGIPLKERWKHRRQSDHMEDGRGEAVDVTIEELLEGLDGPVGTASEKTRKEKVDQWIKDKPERDAQREIREHDQAGTIPTPTPRPQPKTKKTTVTPGSWKTKNKIKSPRQ